MDGNIHAIGWRSVDCKNSRLRLTESQRLVERQRVARRALLGLGRADDDVCKWDERSAKRADADARETVVVRKKYERSQ